jgi:hypothetical protein
MRIRAFPLALVAALVAQYLALAMSGVPAVSAREQCFPETGYCVRDAFLAYWQTHGALPINGYPISGEFTEILEDGQPYTVQYFERVRMEYHPENAPPNDVLLGQFGRRLRPADPPVPAIPGATYFPETGHNVTRAAFIDYWRANGGLPQFGFPISEEIDEVLGGQSYRVQYFERARFEWHPENADPQYQVLLGQFGRQILAGSGGAAPGSVIYQDGFADPGSGWPTTAAPGIGSAGYRDGGYGITIAAPTTLFFPANEKVGALTDTRLEVEVGKLAGPDDAFFGVQCRIRDRRDNLYAALIDASGYAVIYRTQAGQTTRLAETSGNPALRTGNATNRLRFDCVGNTLTLYANGQKILETRDTTFVSGYIGFAALTFDQGGLDVLYRDLTVSRP